MILKLSIKICIIIFTFNIVLSEELLNIEKLDTERLIEKIDNYLVSPASENALQIYKELPTSHVIWIIDSNQISNPDMIDEFLMMLEHQVRASDRNAVRVAFRFFNVSDGYISESLDMMLGELIRINPTLFLEELHSHREIDMSLPHLLGNYGHIYVDRYEAQQLETLLRINALNTIQVDSLLYLRDSCITILKE